ncbi:diguanylate cyclase [Mariprofundus sp. NF]|uniref:diguanylate cyclase n=1 Tax=Mariprofundus sp. NF TaxID=2608716 RepID=UPI0015A3A87E|nr:diguanylate cyclase [Mariprofundus sp. NF]
MSEQQLMKEHESGLIELQKETITRDFSHVVSDLLFLAHQAEFHDVVGAQDWQHLSRHYLEFSSKKRVYDQVRFIDKAGMERVRINYNGGNPTVVADDKLQNKRERYYFQDSISLARGEVFISPFDLNVEHGKIEQPLKPMIRFGTPVFDGEGNLHGMIMLNYLGDNLLDRFARSHSDNPDHSHLLNAEGFWLHGASPENEWGFMYPEKKDQTFARLYPQAWKQIMASDAGQFQSEKGVYTFDTVYPLREGWKSSTGSAEAFMPSSKRIGSELYKWKIVSQIPESELLAKSERLADYLLQLSILFISLLAVGSWLLAKAKLRRRQDEIALLNSEESLNKAQRISHVGNWDLDLSNNKLFWSPEIFRIFAIDPEGFEASYEAFLATIHPDDREKVNRVYRDSVENRTPYEIEHRLLMQDGSLKWVHEHGETLYDDQGAPVRSIGTVQDITERKRSEEALLRSSLIIETIERMESRFISYSEPFALYSDLLDDIIALSESEYGFIGEVLIDPDTKPYLKIYAITDLSWDKKTQDLYDAIRKRGFEFRKLDNLLGKVITSGKAVISDDPRHDPRHGGLPDGHPSIDAFLGMPIYSGGRIVGEIGLANRKGGFDQALLDYMEPLIAACSQIVVARQEQVARRAAEQALENLASMDGLLQIPNRRRFDEYLEQEWRRAERYKTPISLFMIDIDHFKLYNDHYGHQAGDDCLIKVANVIRKSLQRPTDMVARYGGEEFVCILPDTALEGSIPIARKIMNHLLEEKILHAASPVSGQVTLSLGIATAHPGGEESSDQLIALADKHLYQAKESGRNRIVSDEGVIAVQDKATPGPDSYLI